MIRRARLERKGCAASALLQPTSGRSQRTRAFCLALLCCSSTAIGVLLRTSHFEGSSRRHLPLRFHAIQPLNHNKPSLLQTVDRRRVLQPLSSFWLGHAKTGLRESTAKPSASSFREQASSAYKRLSTTVFRTRSGYCRKRSHVSIPPRWAAYDGFIPSGAPLRSFASQDDFPALNQTGSAEGRTGEDGFPHGVAEQVSAAAALQHQHQQREQHRQSLLGSVVGGARTDASLSAARGGFGEPDRNYATKLGAGPPGPGLGVQQQTWAPPGSLFGGNNGGSAPNQLNGLNRSSSPSSARSPLSSVRNAAGNLGASSPLTDNASTRADSVSLGQTGAMAQTPAQQILTSPADRFGLLGLLSLIKSSDPDLSMLSMGVDLQTFGLNLNQSDPLHPSFITPWSENNMLASSRIEPEFTLPSCYNVQPPPPAQSKIASFSDETLFFIFYSTPRDVLQEVAAQELYARNWRYHKELHVWLTKEQGTEPTQKTPTYERGTYVFFDPTVWEKVSKNFHLMYEMLEEKVPSQAQALAAQAAAQQAQAVAAAQQQQQQQQRPPSGQQAHDESASQQGQQS
ncbi:hypothetical protein PHSY_000922 [Pseudozyma hubeiensis SY62]|uniref:NOT2/NOT3/NOT5 C-terminal domain-containing protein n=1 Tax=Pseudozyma hubeiensis (strain SY62) TaxID=1305764 RepID=R9NXS8_PSEHS|nr:hypothetical protein PHSY_000922 [Pseudozyma hubeiensis SY62]GAC93357.1 hypothetical protein PHSY_000922 [Pseudozyma hubeiensis SY62]